MSAGNMLGGAASATVGMMKLWDDEQKNKAYADYMEEKTAGEKSVREALEQAGNAISETTSRINRNEGFGLKPFPLASLQEGKPETPKIDTAPENTQGRTDNDRPSPPVLESTPTTSRVESDTGSVPLTQSGLAVSDGDLSSYLRVQKPKVVGNFIKAGRPDLAKNYLDFINSAEGEAYSRNWLAGMNAVQAGDIEAAVPHFTRLYNKDVPDGRIASVIAHPEDGTLTLAYIDRETGDIKGAQTMKPADLAAMAASSLSPEKRVQLVLAAQQAAAKQSYSMSKADMVEDRKDARAEMHEDRRDARQEASVDTGSGLTVPQQRTNESIIAARRQLTGMSQQDVLKLTQPTTATGRENPSFDPQLARIVKTANTRMYGDDPEFDRFTAGPRSSQSPAKAVVPKSDINDIADRFSADPAMRGYRMGGITPQGREVLDATGQVIGHYR